MRKTKPGRISAFLLTSALLGGCSSKGYTVAFTVASPDSTYIAEMEVLNEGTLGSRRYRINIVSADGSIEKEVFRGTNGWISAPVWQNRSTLIVPFCMGRIITVESYIPVEGADTVKFRTSSTSLIHVHVITAPDSVIGGIGYCSSDDYPGT